VSRLLVIGAGNALRGDDGIGPFVAERLATEGAVTARSVDGSSGTLLEAWEGFDDVVVVDAAASVEHAPGSVLCFDAGAGPLPATALRRSTHDLGVRDAIEMARALGRLPALLTVVAVVGSDFSPLAPLTPAVRRAGEQLAARLAAGLPPLETREPLGGSSMHEMALMRDLMRRIDELARAEGAERVVAVKVRLGALSHLTPEHFREHFEEEARGRVAAGARVDVVTSDDLADPHAQSVILESVSVC
jgi:hydrogenase nickel incorporation protein HypA/HybF